MDWFGTRWWQDHTALAVHLATVVVMCVVRDPFDSHVVPAAMLATMQGTAILWHAMYVVAYRKHAFNDTQNQYKWVEYAMSATAGSVSVLAAGGADTATMIGLAVAAMLQQLGGLKIDMLRHPPSLVQPLSPETCSAGGWREKKGGWQLPVWFVFAAAAQAVEFYFVGVGDAPVLLKVVYMIAWGAFGVHAGLRLLSLRGPVNTVRWPRYSDPRWVESVYSCLGWAAKLVVFATEWAYLNGADLVQGPTAALLALHAVLLFFVVVAVCRWGPHSSGGGSTAARF